LSQGYLRSIYLRLAGVVMLVVAVALGAHAYVSQRTFERALGPDMAKKVAVAAASTRELIVEALEHNIVVSEIYGIEQTFDELKSTIPDIGYAALTDTRGEVLFQRFAAPQGAQQYVRSPEVLALLERPDGNATSTRVGDQYVVSLPVVSPQGKAGILHIGVSVDFVNRIMTDMLLDVVVVLLVALFFTLELLHLMAGRRVEASLNALGAVLERGARGDFTTATKVRAQGMFAGLVFKLDALRVKANASYEELVQEVDFLRASPQPLRPGALARVRAGMMALARRYRFGTEIESTERFDDDKLVKVRAPLFTFILAEELTRPFLPGYVKGLLVPLPWLSPEVVVGLPIVIFMLIVALGQPIMGLYAAKVGNRKAMTVGAMVAAAGFAASALAQTVLDLMLWRSMCAVGYGMVFVAAQAHTLGYADAANRARSFAVFIGAIMVATVCGPSIGGILADNIGERQTFFIAAVLALASVLATTSLPDEPARGGKESAPRMPRLAEIGALVVNPRFMTLTGLAAIPAKVLLAGVCFYMVPLYLLSIGSTQAMAGRVLMVYGIVMVVMMPLGASLAHSRARMESLVGAGLLLSGLGGTMLVIGEGVTWVFAAVGLIGLGQSLSIAAQSALVREHCEREIGSMGEATVYGVYRLLERLGNAAGPLLAALLVLSMGYRRGFVVAGAAVLLCGVLFLAITRAPQLLRRKPAPPVRGPGPEPPSTEAAMALARAPRPKRSPAAQAASSVPKKSDPRTQEAVTP
jgi:MFS family permease